MIRVADMSRYQMHPESTKRIDFGKLRHYGDGSIKGVIFRACVTGMDGSIGEDYRLRQYVEWLMDYNAKVSEEEQLKLCGYYAPLRLEKHIPMQRDFYLETVRNLPKARPIPDLEGARPWGSTRIQAAEMLDDWLVGVTTEVQIWPMIYTSMGWFDYHVAPKHWDAFDLWAARYPELVDGLPTISGPWADGKYKFRDWNACRLWQYGTPAIGLACGMESKELDMSLFFGSDYDFSQWAAGMQLNPIPLPEYVQVTAISPNIRQGPSTLETIVGRAQQYKWIHLAGETKGIDGHTWFELRTWMRDDVVRKV